MNMDDYFRFQREIKKMMEQAAGVNHLRFLDAEVRKAIQPLREPYTALDRALRDRMQPRDLAKEAIAAVMPTGAQLLFETVERQRQNTMSTWTSRADRVGRRRSFSTASNVPLRTECVNCSGKLRFRGHFKAK